MTRIVAVAIGLMLANSVNANAHRLDEYLQAARVSVASASIEVNLDLTPGVSIAPEIIALLDEDRDGRISPLEAEAYGRVVLAEVSARLDGQPLELTLTRVETPTLSEMRDGVGTIRIEAANASQAPRPGPHQFELRNSHRPESSAYLANALAPRNGDIRIVRQQRDFSQRVYSLEYDVRQSKGPAVGWLIAAAAALMAHARWRSRPRLDGRETS